MVTQKTLKKPGLSATSIFILGLSLMLAFLAFHEPVQRTKVSAAQIEKSPQILVGLFRCQEVSVFFASDYAMVTYGQDLSKVQSETSLPSGACLSFRKGISGITWSSQTQGGPKAQDESFSITLYPLTETSIVQKNSGFKVTQIKAANVSFEGFSFPGGLVLMADGDSIQAANLLDVESYVTSVVSAEMPFSFPLEAKKAQAIAARSYAVYKTGITSQSQIDVQAETQPIWKRPYAPTDIKITALDQVYRGFYGVDPKSFEASNDTRGEILCYEGKVVPCYYHADAATMTEDVKYVWGGGSPCLTAVAEIPHVSPHSYWEVSYSKDEFSSLMGKLNLAGKVLHMDAVSPGISGRWGQVRISVDGKKAVLKAGEFRSAAGLKSMLFSVYDVGGMKDTTAILNAGLIVQVQGASGVVARKAGDLSGVSAEGQISSLSQGMYALGPSWDGPELFVFQGQGYGHGVGMSQWGAKAMAQNGSDFRDILSHYYRGASIVRVW